MASSPITSTHIEYGASLLKWGRLRDAVAGRDAIMAHDAAEALKPAKSRNSYLPPLSDQDQAEYAAMQARASWFGATDRTVNALAGLIFAKDPEVKAQGAINGLLRDIDLSGTNLRDFAQKVVVEELTTSRVGLMVEFPNTDTSAMTQAEAELANARPYITAWAAEQIQDWRVGNVPGQGSRLTMVKLRESVATFENDLSPAVYVTQYRILDLFEGFYRQRVYREDSSKEWALAVEIFPTSQNERLRYIPFTIVGGTEVRKPLLLDLADVNFAHYRTDADYSHALHMSALPTPWAAGFRLPDGAGALRIGSGTAWVTDDSNAKAGFLEFSGQGLEPLRNRLADLEKQMAILGARSLGGEKASNETATGVELRSAGERGTLAGVAADVSDAIRQCLDWMAARFGASAGAKFSLNRDYGLHRMDPQMLAQLVAAYQSGAMPVSVLFSNLKRGDIVPADMDEQTYTAGLDEATPTIARGQE